MLEYTMQVVFPPSTWPMLNYSIWPKINVFLKLQPIKALIHVGTNKTVFISSERTCNTRLRSEKYIPTYIHVVFSFKFR